MCAISGVIGLEAAPEVISQMLDTMYRRGPDGQGVYQEEKTTLLHSRLAVIDIEGGKQPMSLQWGGETYTLVYNGELYNTHELRSELQKRKHIFHSYSDTEVLLHAYCEFGSECTQMLNGIFAFAVWEKRRGRLFLARDRIGVKPLFYRFHNEGFLFASEIKTILAYPGVKAQLDADGARQLLLFGPGRMPGSGIFKDIFEIEPGCCGFYENGKLQLSRYWQLRDREHTDTFEETAEYVRFLVQDAIHRQMVSDVPIGCFLSGGLDSSIITAVCGSKVQKREGRLKTFSVDYQNNDRYFQANKYQPNTDGAYIDTMVSAFDTEHHASVLSVRELIEAMETATIARDLPGMADVDFSLLSFCGDVRREVKVALSGECADEIFGGYPWYRDPEVRAMEGFPWAQNTRQRIGLLHPLLRRGGEEMVMEAYRDTCRQSDILPGNTEQERRMKEMVNLNFRWFMQTLLERKDRMSMFHALEVRVPFCDYRIAEYLYGVPWEFKDYQGREKGLLRHAVAEWIPEEIRCRKKSPYPKTFDPTYEEQVFNRLRFVMQQDAPIWQLIEKEAVSVFLNTTSPWPWYGQLMRRPQTIAYFLQLDFWLRHYQVEICY